MLWELSSDQEFFRQTTAKFLTDQVPVATVRRLRDDPQGFSSDYWRRGAELGWTSLLIDEERGGGSISGEGVVDLSVIAHEFGAHAAPGPLTSTNLVAAGLNDAGSDAQLPALEAIAAGAVAAWCLEESPGRSPLATPELEVRAEGGDLVLSGTKRAVESADVAEFFLVTGRSAGGITQVLVPAGTPGLTVTPMKSVDLTRRFFGVRFDDVRVPAESVVGEFDGAAEQVTRQFHLAGVLAAAESVGAMQTAFDLTVQWAFDRYSFGRPLASYQAIKHRFADMTAWLQTGHALADAAAAAVQARSDDAADLVSAAKAYIGQYGSELMQECVQFHGGIGVTFEHDLHLYLRRLAVDRGLYGTPADHRQLLATSLEHRKDAA